MKRYSSGMYVRLAFAVAAHLEPEILLVDEVLSVGDYAFQVKSLAHMERLEGIGDDRHLCLAQHADRVYDVLPMLRLEPGKNCFRGRHQPRPWRITIRYHVNRRATRRRPRIGRGIEDRVILGGAAIEKLQFINQRGVPVDVLRSGEQVTCEMEVRFAENRTIRSPLALSGRLKGRWYTT